MPTFKIYTLGCKVNQYDSLDLQGKLKNAKFKPTSESADLVIVNTCSVTKNANRKDRQMIKKVRMENPKAKIVVMGCWYKVYPQIVEKIEADLFWPVGKLDELVVKIHEVFKDVNRLKEQGLNSSRAEITPPGKRNRARYFMKVQDGCEQFCSYCVIPYSRGKLKSRNWKEIIKETQAVEEAGYREINLCGIHLGLYGVDSGESKNAKKDDKQLAWLIKKIIDNTKKVRIRISSIEVNDVTDELIQLLKTEKRFCNHLHIPLQGGEDKLLQLMNRPYNTNYYKNKVDKIRRAVPDVAITADIIVGFPSETKNQFKKTWVFIKELNLNKLHVFAYSKHDRTAAARMPGHLDNKTKQARSKILRELSNELWLDYQKQIRDKYSKLEVIVEQDREGGVVGKTEYYFNIQIPKDKIKSRELIVGNLVLVNTV